MPPTAIHHSEGFEQRHERGVKSPDLYFKEMTAWERMNLKGAKAGDSEMRGIHPKVQI